MQMTLSSVDDLDNGLESFSDRSISFGKDDSRIPYNGRESEPTLLNCCGSKMMIVENSYSFKEIEPETNGDGESTVRLDRNESSLGNSPRQECGVERYHAAVKLQKTYKSFRTRRQLADCAVLVEQRWWKLLEFAELRRNSVSFFDDEKPETAVSRWSRARTKAAKVGKGLSKDERARQLALQHWLEAIDPRHRYGHNLQFYYVKWLQCENNEPFFYWLDIGEGREITHEKCTRSKLQQQCIKYLGPMERKEFEVRIDDGKFIYNQSGLLLDTRGGPEDTKWIFVLSVSKILYVGRKKKGKFQHSSFLAGGATLSAGRLIVEDGILKTVWPHSGHYLPTQENFDEFMSFLKQHNVDLSVVQQVPREEDDEKESSFLRISVSEPDIKLPREETKDTEPFRNSSKETGIIYKPRNRLPKKISFIQIPPRDIMMELFDYEKQLPKLTVLTRSQHAVLTPTDGYKTAKDNLTETEFSVSKVDDETQEGEHENENTLEKRIHSHKGMKSYKLAQQLSSRWSTGAGPRIGFVRDYPPELQFRALEEVSLSPRSSMISPSGRFGRPSPRLPTSSNLCRKTTVGRSNLASEPVIVIDTVI